MSFNFFAVDIRRSEIYRIFCFGQMFSIPLKEGFCKDSK